jgi:hypothetical protein
VVAKKLSHYDEFATLNAKINVVVALPLQGNYQLIKVEIYIGLNNGSQ